MDFSKLSLFYTSLTIQWLSHVISKNAIFKPCFLNKKNVISTFLWMLLNAEIKMHSQLFHQLQFKSLLDFICNHSRNCKGRSSSRGRCISHMKNAISNNPNSSIKYKIFYQISISIQSLGSYSGWASAKPRVQSTAWQK